MCVGERRRRGGVPNSLSLIWLSSRELTASPQEVSNTSFDPRHTFNLNLALGRQVNCSTLGVLSQPRASSFTMRFSNHQRSRPLSTTTLIPTLLLALSSLIQPALAGPYPKDEQHDTLGFGFLLPRGCAGGYCGADNQFCCDSGETCTTTGANIALCTNVANAGGYGPLYTTTWTETDIETFTSTVSTYYPAATATAGGGAACTPAAGSGQVACGTICCANWQYCAFDGQCSAGNSGVSSTYSTWTSTVTTAGSTITTQYSAPYRVTSGTTVTTTAGTNTGTSTGTLVSATSTGNGTAVATTGGSSLSPGAIAGIVIGVILGVALLLAICACCLVRSLWHGFLAIFGLGPGKKRRSSRDRETVIVEEERYARRGGSTHSRRDTHRGWFAARPARSAAAESRRTSGRTGTINEKRKSGGDGAGWLGAGAVGTLLLLLGLKRDKKRRESTAPPKRSGTAAARSDVSSSYFSDYTVSSPSELSSDYTYSSVYTRPTGLHDPRDASAAAARSHMSASGAGKRGPELAKSNIAPSVGSASSGGRTRDTRRSRRTETTRISRAPSRR